MQEHFGLPGTITVESLKVSNNPCKTEELGKNVNIIWITEIKVTYNFITR